MKNYKDNLKINENNILQIGSHDGVVGEEYGFIEFIRTISNNVVMVEPVSAYMDLLKSNMKGCISNITFLECGVRNFDGTGKITLEGGMSSFKGNFGVHNSEVVKIVSWNTLMCMIPFSDIDLLLLDTEGCESEIIGAIDFGKTNIRTIRWEYHNLSRGENESIISKMLANGYSIDYCSHDTLHNLVAWK